MAQEENKPSYEELQALYAASLKRTEDLEGEVATSTELIGELNLELENAKAGLDESEVVVVTHEGNQYKVVATKFRYKGTEYAAKDLSKNAELVAKLVETESGVLRKLEKAKPAAKAAKKDETKK